MSRTVRKSPYDKDCFRHRAHQSEARQIESILLNYDANDYPLSKLNRLKTRRVLPSYWDDMIASSKDQMDYHN